MGSGTTQARITIRRTVPFEVEGGYTLTINAMRTDPDSAILGVTSAVSAERLQVGPGDTLVIGDRVWEVASVVVGDRGSVVLTSPGTGNSTTGDA